LANLQQTKKENFDFLKTFFKVGKDRQTDRKKERKKESAGSLERKIKTEKNERKQHLLPFFGPIQLN